MTEYKELDNIWKTSHDDTLKAICKQDDQNWYLGLDRMNIKQLQKQFSDNVEPEVSDLFSISIIISHIESNPVTFFRRTDPAPEPLTEDSTLSWPSKEPWDQTAFDATHNPSSKAWRDYEDAALRLSVEANISWPLVAKHMNTLAESCGWGSWNQRPRRFYTPDSVSSHAKRLGLRLKNN